MSAQTTSRHQVSCCKHAGSTLHHAAMSAASPGCFHPKCLIPPSAPPIGTAWQLTSPRNEIFGLDVSHPAMPPARAAVSMLSRRIGVIKMGCCRHRALVLVRYGS